MGEHAYAGRILRIDLSSRTVSTLATADHADEFIGGRGIAAKIFWDEVPAGVTAFSPENRMIVMTGPLAGFPVLGSSRWTVCAMSPATDPERFSYCNLGGRWGATLKFAGYDGIVIHGKAQSPVYLLIRDGVAEIGDASALWGKSTTEVRDTLKDRFGKSARVLACGPAGENLVACATLLADDDASGSGGLGAVMGSKRLKAIVVDGSVRIDAAEPEKLLKLTAYFRGLQKLGAEKIEGYGTIAYKDMKKEVCYGCIGGCPRKSWVASDGTKGKSMCASGLFYVAEATQYYGEWNEVPFFANRLADQYGLDIASLHALIIWLSLCRKHGILNDNNTGLALSKLGSLEFIRELIEKISVRSGFGEVLAQGIYRAADTVGNGARDLVTDYSSKEGAYWIYCPRMFITTGLLYAMEPRRPVAQLHEVSTMFFPWMDWIRKSDGAFLSNEVFRQIALRLWGSEIAADFSTYEGKAQAARMIQDRQCAKESLILCDFMWPIRYVKHSMDHLGDLSLESRLLSAATGKKVEPEELTLSGERIFNVQRAILGREGHRGRTSDVLPGVFYNTPLKGAYANPDCLVPGPGDEVISRKGAVVERDKFEKMKDEYYQLRGWDVGTGLQTKATLDGLGLGQMVAEMQRAGLVV